jgi:hypothetical protein
MLTSNLHPERPAPVCSATGLVLDQTCDWKLIPQDGWWFRWHKHADGTECFTKERRCQ